MVGRNGCVVLFCGAGFGESNRAVVGNIGVPVECGAVEAVFDLVEWVVVDVESVQFGCGCSGFVGVVRLSDLYEGVWVEYGLVEKVGFSCILATGWVHFV